MLLFSKRINRTFWWRHKDSLWAHKKLIWDLWKSDELIVKSKEEAKKAALDILPGTTNRDPKHQEERREELQVKSFLPHTFFQFLTFHFNFFFFLVDVGFF